MLAGQQASLVQVGVDRLGHLAVGHGRVRRLDVHDQMRRRDGCALFIAVAGGAGGVARLGHVGLVAVPEGVALDAPPGIGVVGGGDPGSARRETLHLRLPPSDHLPSPLVDDDEVVLHKHHPQHLDLLQPGQERQVRVAGRGGVHRLEQGVTIATVGQGELVFPGRGRRHAPGVDAGGVPVAPRVVQELRHHLRRGHRQLLQAGPHRLPGQLPAGSGRGPRRSRGWNRCAPCRPRRPARRRPAVPAACPAPPDPARRRRRWPGIHSRSNGRNRGRPGPGPARISSRCGCGHARRPDGQTDSPPSGRSSPGQAGTAASPACRAPRSRPRTAHPTATRRACRAPAPAADAHACPGTSPRPPRRPAARPAAMAEDHLG